VLSSDETDSISAEMLALIESGDRVAVATLLEYSRHDYELVRMSAYNALGAIPDGVPADMLVDGVSDPSWRVQGAALLALCAHDTQKAADAAAAMCAGPPNEVTYRALLVLRDSGRAEHLGTLTSAADRLGDKYATEATAARQAIERRVGHTTEPLRDHDVASLALSAASIKSLRRRKIHSLGELLDLMAASELETSDLPKSVMNDLAGVGYLPASGPSDAMPAPPAASTTAEMSLRLLRSALQSPTAEFHDGQLEAIESLVDESARLLVVERTGWGKSMVYFVATSLLRGRGKGPTLIVSPLLSLMRNQLEAADRLGLRAATINCENNDEHATILGELAADEVDLLLIAPERFANADFREKVLASLGQHVGMLVVDEAHCISDWGHDFRPDYRRIARVIQAMPSNLPVLATTATANNRVVADVLEQIGAHAQIIRGTLRRDSLRLQNVQLPSYASRLAWLAGTLPGLSGSGIVYVLTKRDAETVAEWLLRHNINAAAYHGGSTDRTSLEQDLIHNRVKVLVATTALGMGFDKPDLGFVIHFQRPGSAIHYYQQVGRAGRGIPWAFGILLAGAEDDEIAEYFIKNALPSPELMRGVVEMVRQNSEEGLNASQLAARFNVRKGKMDQALKLLETEVPSPISKERFRWFPTPVTWQYDDARAEALTSIRRTEQERMSAYVTTDECLQVFLARELDADDLAPCGSCSVCVGETLLPVSVDERLVQDALGYLKLHSIPIFARKQWPGDAMLDAHGWQGRIAQTQRCETGRALCRWGDPSWGSMVRDGKRSGHFDDDLVQAAADLILTRWQFDVQTEWVTCVPSLRHNALVPDFARRLASALRLPFIECVNKVRESRPQKDMNNSWNQARNLAGVFAVNADAVLPGAVLLVDDMVDSKWTFTIIGALLQEHGSGLVFPFALADTSQSGA